MKDAVKSAKHSLPTHKVASDVPESNYYVMKKEGVKTNEWAMLNMFSAEKRMNGEAKKKEAAQAQTRHRDSKILKKTRRRVKMPREKKSRRIKNIG